MTPPNTDHATPGLVARAVATVVERALPGLDWGRIWRGEDLVTDDRRAEPFEQVLAKKYRPLQPVIAAVTLAVFVAGIWATYGLGARAFSETWADRPLVAIAIALLGGLFVHGAFAFVVHEGTHHNLFLRRIDRWISDAALGLMLMPFAAERYQTLHLYHHRRVLDVDDPNWTASRDRLWKRARVLYVVFELLPLVNNLERLWSKEQPTLKRDARKVLVAWVFAIGTWYVLRPPVGYFVLVQVGVNVANAWRLWVEHFGPWRGRIANTYYFPLTFGAGNHLLHHVRPHVPAWAQAVGLMVRRLDVSTWQAPVRVLFDSEYGPFPRRKEAEISAPSAPGTVPATGLS